MAKLIKFGNYLQVPSLPIKNSALLRKTSGVTLIELMIVLAVLAILVSLAFPIYQAQMRENRRTDGQRTLMEVMHAQQKFFSRNSIYTADLIGDLGFTDAGSGAVLSENQFYLITTQNCAGLGAINDCVELLATPQGIQIADGNLTYNSRNQKTPVAKW